MFKLNGKINSIRHHSLCKCFNQIWSTCNHTTHRNQCNQDGNSQLFNKMLHQRNNSIINQSIQTNGQIFNKMLHHRNIPSRLQLALARLHYQNTTKPIYLKAYDQVNTLITPHATVIHADMIQSLIQNPSASQMIIQPCSIPMIDHR